MYDVCVKETDNFKYLFGMQNSRGWVDIDSIKNGVTSLIFGSKTITINSNSTSAVLFTRAELRSLLNNNNLDVSKACVNVCRNANEAIEGDFRGCTYDTNTWYVVFSGRTTAARTVHVNYIVSTYE